MLSVCDSWSGWVNGIIVEVSGCACAVNHPLPRTSFHIGSGSEDPKAYTRAIEMAHTVFQYGESIGYNFTLLDIGGGFPGGSNSNHLFTKMSNAINTSVLEHFSDKKNLKVIAEPGRFFAASTHTLAVCVISKREMEVDGEKVCLF